MRNWIMVLIGQVVKICRKTPLVKSRVLKKLYYGLYALLRPKNLTLLHLDSGLKLLVDPADRGVASFLITTGHYEPFECQLVSQTLTTGDWSLDVGGNIGYHAIHMAKAVGSNGQVISCEPAPQNFELLQKNIEQNGQANWVQCIAGAIGKQKGTTQLFLNPQNRGDHRIFSNQSEARESIEVPVYKLDDLVPPNTPIKLVKLDIQGAEWMALQGMTRILSENENIHIFMEFWSDALRFAGADITAMIDFLLQQNFHAFQILESKSCLEALSKAAFYDISTQSEEYNLLLAKKPQSSPLKSYFYSHQLKT